METMFENPFQLEDLLVFDEANFCRIIGGCAREVSLENLAWGMHTASPRLLSRLLNCFSPEQRARFVQQWLRPVPRSISERARHLLLDKFFWELTYWKTPELYEELTAGEQLHPGIFQQLEPLVRGKIVLDAGAGSGRASFECARHGARLVYAVEPSPGLLRLLNQKRVSDPSGACIRVRSGDFTHVPLASRSVDLALACSAFTAEPQCGGEPGLAELRRVVRSGGYLVIIWPRPQDRSWLTERGFQYSVLPCAQEMCVHFSSRASALRCIRRFYAGNQEALRYLLHHQQPEVPFSVLRMNAPCDYCWLRVS
jgi:SAM-dependent methyltransferase